jgi:hypothetical protein
MIVSENCISGESKSNLETAKSIEPLLASRIPLGINAGSG